MGSSLRRLHGDKCTEQGSTNGLRYALATMQGWRHHMEDTHKAVVNLPNGLDNWSFFAIFDGHNGRSVSDYCAENLLDTIIRNENFLTGVKDLSNTGETTLIETCVRDAFLQLDEEMRTSLETEDSGSTAVCCLISPEHIFLINCGDSRAVVFHDNKPSLSTLDHKPPNPIERERIEKAGGNVFLQRVNGLLAVSRALGDFHYKDADDKDPCEQLVSPEPEIFVTKRDNEKDTFLVLACDGIWDVVTNGELGMFLHSELLRTDNLISICEGVIDTCLASGSKDNMSVLIIELSRTTEKYLGKGLTENLDQDDHTELH